MYVSKRNNENVTLKLYSINPDGKTDKIKQEVDIFPIEQARNLRRCALKAGKTSARKTENLAHLTYLHAESGMRNKSKLGHL